MPEGWCGVGEPTGNGVDPALMASAVESLAEGIVLVDARGRILYVNRAFAEGLGLPAEQVVGLQWDDPVLRVSDLEGRPIPSEKRALQRVLATRRAVLGYDYFVYHVSGRAVRVLLNGVPVWGADGLAGVAFTMTDITPRMASEDTLRQELETTTTLLGLSQALSESTDLERVLAVVTGAVLEATPHSRSYVFNWKEDQREVALAASAGAHPFLPDTTFSFDSLSSTTKRLVEERRAAVVDFDALPEEQRGHGLAEQESHLTAVAPLVFAGHLVGLVGVDDPGERREFTEREIDVIRGIAAQAAVAIENARLFESERERARLAESLTAIDHGIHGTMSPDQMFRHVLPEAAVALGTDGAAAGTRQSNGWCVGYEYHLRPGLVGRVFTDDELATAALAAGTRQVVVVDNALADARVNLATVRGFDARSFIVGPLIALDEVVGVVYLVHKQRLHTFSTDEVEFVRRLSISLGLALANARLYESEHNIAETLQTALLALPERMPGIEFAHLYRSATEAARVGGDFYDLFELDHQRLGITVGDISGHGIDAAVLTSLVKNAIRVQATQENKTPNEVMASASSVLYDNSPPEIFATVFFGVLDCTDGRLVYCSAGHTTGACVCSNRGVLSLPANSPLLGAFRDEEFELSTECLDVNDLLFLYTDGLTEARRDHELFGDERLFELLAHERSGSPEQTLRKVVDKVLSFTGGKLSDDLAILALQRGEDVREV
jgi:PAS domain S-box-containing protein